MNYALTKSERENRRLKNLYSNTMNRLYKEQRKNIMLTNRLTFVFEEYGKIKQELETVRQAFNDYTQRLTSKKKRK